MRTGGQTSQKTLRLSYEVSMLIGFRETITLYYETNMKHINTTWRANAEFFLMLKGVVFNLH
jgi:hypothetical protein